MYEHFDGATIPTDSPIFERIESLATGEDAKAFFQEVLPELVPYMRDDDLARLRGALDSAFGQGWNLNRSLSGGLRSVLRRVCATVRWSTLAGSRD